MSFVAVRIVVEEQFLSNACVMYGGKDGIVLRIGEICSKRAEKPFWKYLFLFIVI